MLTRKRSFFFRNHGIAKPHTPTPTRQPIKRWLYRTRKQLAKHENMVISVTTDITQARTHACLNFMKLCTTWSLRTTPDKHNNRATQARGVID